MRQGEPQVCLRVSHKKRRTLVRAREASVRPQRFPLKIVTYVADIPEWLLRSQNPVKWLFVQRRPSAFRSCDVDLGQSLKMPPLQAFERSAGDNELRSVESFAPEEIDERLNNEVFLVADCFSQKIAGHIDDC